MSVNFVPQSIHSGYNLDQINSNFTDIQNDLVDALSRSGHSPNSMLVDFDLNSHNLLNGAIGYFQNMFIAGVDIHNVVGLQGPTGLTGPAGANGTSFTWKGTYAGGTTYAKNDVAQDQNSSWIALGATTGNSPPTLPTTVNAFWQLVAAKGVDGANGAGTGTVTSVSVTSGNGFAGSVGNPTTTPAITLSTTVTGIVKGNGTSISAATSGTDYEVPITAGTGLTRTVNTLNVNSSQSIATLSNLATNGFVKTGGGVGTLSVDTTSYQPLDSDLTAIAALTATTDNFLQSKASNWSSRTPTQVTADLIAMVGDSGAGGTKGLVPAPAAGDAAASKFLKADGTWATASGGTASIVLNTISAASYTIVSGDRSKLLKFTGGADSTWTFSTAATLGSGWFTYLQNAGTSNASIILSPTGPDQVDGLTTYNMFPGEVRLLQCDGTNFRTVVLHGFLMSYSTTTTGVVVPPGYKAFNIDAWGGGASGGVATSTGSAAGGGGGSHDAAYNVVATLFGATWDATVGAGGGAVASSNANGNPGGESKLVSNSITLVDAFGGGGGFGQSTAANNSWGGGGGGTAAVGAAGGNGTGGAGGAAQTAPNLKPYVSGAGASGGASNGVSATDGGASGGQGRSAAGNQNGAGSTLGGASGAGTNSTAGGTNTGGSSTLINSVGGGVSSTGVPSAASGIGAGGGAGRNGNASGAGTAGAIKVAGII